MSDSWSRLRLTLPSSFVDWVSAEAVEWGAPGVEVIDTMTAGQPLAPGLTTLHIYFPAASIEASRSRLETFLQQLGEQAEPYRLGRAEPTPEVDWAEQWRYHFPPLEIGDRLLILPPWERERDPGTRIPILLQPGMAFGTGHHPTTALILEELERTIASAPPETMLDIGCGSGILSMGAVALGAERVLAIDYDRDAVEAARANIVMNGMADRALVTQARFPDLPSRAPFDLVVANVYFTFFRMENLALGEVMAPGSVLLASGLREDEGSPLLSSLRSAGFESVIVDGSDGWIVIRGVRQ